MRRRTVPLAAVFVMGTVLTPVVAPVAVASASPTAQSFLFNCSNGRTTKLVTTGLAAITTAPIRIHVTQVKFAFQNSFATTITMTAASFTVPDPNNVSAPYLMGAQTGPTPAGWTGTHVPGEIQANFAGSMTLPSGGTFTSAPLQAKYSDNGPPGTIVKYRPGPFTLSLSTGTVTCTPVSTPPPFASVTE